MKMIELIESMKAITDNGDSLAPFGLGCLKHLIRWFACNTNVIVDASSSPPFSLSNFRNKN